MSAQAENGQHKVPQCSCHAGLLPSCLSPVPLFPPSSQLRSLLTALDGSRLRESPFSISAAALAGPQHRFRPCPGATILILVGTPHHPPIPLCIYIQLLLPNGLPGMETSCSLPEWKSMENLPPRAACEADASFSEDHLLPGFPPASTAAGEKASVLASGARGWMAAACPSIPCGAKLFPGLLPGHQHPSLGQF